jgi:shikimate dehydrogenase
MAARMDIAEIQKCISNSLDAEVIGAKRLAGIIGDSPSQYSKSPALWNAAFRHLGINAVYLPLDVDESRLGNLIAALRASDRFAGINVTVPHKIRIMAFMDDLDPGAARIQAVNTVVKTSAGKLMGYNTDGEGFVQSVLTAQPGAPESFIESLKGMDVLLLGAGGSARAVAFHVSAMLDGGQLLICNRTMERAATLAAEVKKGGGNAKAIREEEIPTYARTVGLIVNSTTKGQGGMRKLSSGQVTNLEPYSSLALADTPPFAESDLGKANFPRIGSEAAEADIESNNQASMNLAKSIPQSVGFYDLIYHPQETVFLRHGRETGHKTMNGKAMIINQAVIAFCERICSADLQARGIDTPETGKQILAVMYRAW